MSTGGLDMLAYTRDLESAGFNRGQAEAIARGNYTMLAERFDALVTRDHFDLTTARIDQRFERMDQRFEQVDERFAQLEARVGRVDHRLDRIEDCLGGFATMKSQVTVLTWMMGLVVLTLVVPQLQAWFSPV